MKEEKEHAQATELELQTQHGVFSATHTWTIQGFLQKRQARYYYILSIQNKYSY